MRKKANNEGSIYKDKQGHWRGVVTLYSADGKPKKKYFYGKPESAKLNFIKAQKVAVFREKQDIFQL